MTDCIPALQRALGEQATPEDLEKLYSQIKDAVFAHAAELMRDGMARGDALIQAARRLGDETRMQSFIAKRNAALNLTARTRHTAWVQANFGTNFARGFESILVGLQSAKTGTRLSAMSEQHMLKHTYLTGLGEDMRRAGVWELFIKGDKAYDRDTFKAWYALGDANEAALLRDLNPHAVETARIIAARTEHARLDANDAGAWIGKLDNWAGRQTHNAELIFNAGARQYATDAAQMFDLPRMLSERGASDADAMLKELFKTLAADVHETVSNPLVGNVGTRNIGKGLSQSRTVHFKDADSAWAYNQKYGGNYSPQMVWGGTATNTQSLAHSVFRQLENMAQATGLMRVMGPNPQALLKSLIDHAETTLRGGIAGRDAKAVKKNLDLLTARRDDLDQFMAAIDGSTNQVASALKAKIGQSLRTWTQVVDLGGMLLSQFSDVAQHMSGANYRGKGYLSGLHEAVTGLFGTNLKDQATRQLAASLGVMIDNFMGEMARAGSFDVPGQTSKMLQFFYKANGANWWNSHMRFAAAAGISNDLAGDAGKAFADLHPSMQRLLGQYDIGATQWETIRHAALHEVGGNAYLLPENVADRKLSDRLRTLITDQTGYSQLDPDAKTRAMMMNFIGGQAGTTKGEIARSVLLFKSFNAAFMQKTIGRELFGRGFEYDNASSTNVLRAIVGGKNGEQTALANLVLLATTFGYASMVAKDVAKGIAPQDPSTLTNGQRVALILRAAQQGGGAGIYGDFLLGQANRAGGGVGDTILGPVLGRATGAAQWFVKMRDELAKGEVKPDVGAALFKGLESSIPGNNLFYARFALDYFINYRAQEALNPGFLQRREAQLQRDSQQHFIVRPQIGAFTR